MIDAVLKYFHSLTAVMDLSFSWTNMFEIFIIALILFVFYKKFIKNTQSEKFVKGAFFLVFVWIMSEILIRLDLKILGVFFMNFL